MKKGNFFNKTTSARSSGKNKSPKQRRLNLEPLESRAMLSVTYGDYSDVASIADSENAILAESVGMADAPIALPEGIENVGANDSDSLPLITTATKVRTPNLAATSATYNSVTLKISSLARYASRINIRYSTDPNFSTQSDPIPVDNPQYHKTFDASKSVTTTITGLSPDTTYYFRARAVNADDGYELSDWSATVNKKTDALTIVRTPVLAKSSTTIDSVTLTASNLAVHASQYNIRYSTNPAFATTADPANFSGSSGVSITNASDGSANKTITGLSPNTTYYFRARAVKVDAGYAPSNWSASLSVTTDSNVVRTPKLTAGSTTYNSTTLTISDIAPHASRFNITYSKDPNFAAGTVSDPIPVANTYHGAGFNANNKITVTVDGLDPGTKYYFRARAVNVDSGYAISDFSVPVDATTKPLTIVRTPNLALSSKTYNSVTLTASNLAVHASKYNIRYSTDPAFATTADPANFSGSSVVSITNASDGSANKTISELDPDTTYYFRARAVQVDDGYAPSNWSASVSVKTDALSKVKTPVLEAKSTTYNSATFTISNIAPHAKRFNITYSKDPNFATGTVSDPQPFANTYYGESFNANNKITATVSGLEPGTKYYFRARAVLVDDGYAVSDHSTVVSATTKELTKVRTPVLAKSSTTINSITLTASNLAVHASKYNIRYSTDPAFATTSDPANFSGSSVVSISNSGDGSQSVPVNNLNPDTTYYFRARAVQVDAGYAPSDWSDSLEVKTNTNKVRTPVLTANSTTYNSATLTISDIAPHASRFNITYSKDPNFAAGTVSDPIPVANTYHGAGFNANNKITVTVDGLEPGTKYYFRARAVNVDDGYVISDFSNTVNATTKGLDPCRTPELTVNSSLRTYNSVTLTISNIAPHAERFNITYSKDPNFATGTVSDPIAVTNTYHGNTFNANNKIQTTISGLEPGTRYYFRARAVRPDDGYDVSEHSAIVSGATEEPTIVRTPELAVKSTTTNSATLTISNIAPHAKRFNITYSTDPNFATGTVSDPVPFANTYYGESFNANNKITATVSGLEPGTKYYFRARAVLVDEGYAVSDHSTVVSATTPMPGKLATPTISITSTTATAAQIKIGSVANAAKYVVEYSMSDDFANSTTKTYSSSGSKWITGLTKNATYYFRVKATATGYTDSDWSKAVTNVTKVKTPVLTAHAKTYDSATVKISNLAVHASQFNIRYSTDPNFATASDPAHFAGVSDPVPFTWDGSSETITAKIENLNPNTTYYFRARAVEVDAGYAASDWSDAVAIKTNTNIVRTPELAVSSTTTNSVKLIVSNLAVHASQYNIRYSTDPAFATTADPASFAGSFGPETIANTGADSATKTIDGLSPNTTYYFRARAVKVDNGYEPSDWSVAVSAKTKDIQGQLATPAFSIASKTATAVQIQIGAVANASKYVVEYSTSDNFANSTTKPFSSSGSKWITGLTKNTTYYFRVKATATGYIDSNWSDVITNATKVITPTLAAHSKTYNSVTLKISNLAVHAGKFNIRYSTDPAFATTTDPAHFAGVSEPVPFTWDGSSETITAKVTGLDPSTTYYFRARAVDVDGGYAASDWSVAVTVKTNTNIVRTPKLSLDSKTHNSIAFSVKNIAYHAEKLRFEYSTDSTFASGVHQITVSNAFYHNEILDQYGDDVEILDYDILITLLELNPETTYYIRGKAINVDTGYVASGWSETLSATTNATPNRLVAPTTSIASKTATAVQIQIDPVANASKYVVEYSTNSNFTNSTTKSYSSSGAKWITGLTKNTTYYFRVKATATGYSDSDWSETVTNATKVKTPVLEFYAKSQNSVTLTISNLAVHANQFNIRYSTDPNFATASDPAHFAGVSDPVPFAWDGSAETIAARIANLNPGTTYYFRARAVEVDEGYAASDWSGAVAVATNDNSSQLQTPAVSIVNKTATAVQIKINPVANAALYVLEYATNPDFVNPTSKSFASSGSKWITGLSKNTTYYFRVKARGTGFADSNYSETVSNVESSSSILDASDAVFAEIAWNDLSDDEDVFETLELDLNGFFLDD